MAYQFIRGECLSNEIEITNIAFKKASDTILIIFTVPIFLICLAVYFDSGFNMSHILSALIFGFIVMSVAMNLFLLQIPYKVIIDGENLIIILKYFSVIPTKKKITLDKISRIEYIQGGPSRGCIRIHMNKKFRDFIATSNEIVKMIDDKIGIEDIPEGLNENCF